jgi:hypothetical protein
MKKELYRRTHAAVTDSLAERLQELGGIVADRGRISPAPRTATLDDLAHAGTQDQIGIA